MRVPTRVVGILLILVGVVWFLQGINLLPGSFMTGQPEWAVAGVLTFLAGFWMIRRSRRADVDPGRRDK